MVTHPGTLSRLKAQPSEGSLDLRELQELERRFVDGVSSAEILRIFQARGVRLSEGTFRKYVQLGLLSRSKRVGTKGKHQGSKGLYPATILRQIVAIKEMMGNGLTIEQIQRSWLRFRPRIEAIEADVTELLDDMARELEGPHFDTERRAHLAGDLETARQEARELLDRLLHLEQEVAWSPEKAAEDATATEPGLEPARKYY